MVQTALLWHSLPTEEKSDEICYEFFRLAKRHLIPHSAYLPSPKGQVSDAEQGAAFQPSK